MRTQSVALALAIILVCPLASGQFVQQGNKLVGAGAEALPVKAGLFLFQQMGIPASCAERLTAVAWEQRGSSRGAVVRGVSRGTNLWAKVL
jgi:hypothetical protein